MNKIVENKNEERLSMEINIINEFESKNESDKKTRLNKIAFKITKCYGRDISILKECKDKKILEDKSDEQDSNLLQVIRRGQK